MGQAAPVVTSLRSTSTDFQVLPAPAGLVATSMFPCDVVAIQRAGLAQPIPVK